MFTLPHGPELLVILFVVVLIFGPTIVRRLRTTIKEMQDLNHE